jgi:hypothetical protein
MRPDVRNPRQGPPASVSMGESAASNSLCANVCPQRSEAQNLWMRVQASRSSSSEVA